MNNHPHSLPLLRQTHIDNQIIVIRSDLNVPIKNGIVADDTRIKESLETFAYCLSRKSKIIIISHLGRPVEGGSNDENEQYSLKPVANSLSHLLNKQVEFVSNWENFDFKQSNCEVFLLENIRFNAGETDCDDALSQKIANLGDALVIDAFGTSHRKHASTYGAVYYAKKACAGFLLEKEVDSLNKALNKPKPPVLAIVGGAKVSSKLLVIKNLIDKVHHIILGGGIINTFLLAQGYKVGNSLVEKNLVGEAKDILNKAKEKMCEIHLPTDVMTTKDFNNPVVVECKKITQVVDDDIIMDIGYVSAKNLESIVSKCQTILWNGPIGVFEQEKFANGTKSLTSAICKQTDGGAFSIAGGGDTISAINQFNASNHISYISTGGGAFLEFIEGKQLPVVQVLLEKNGKSE